MFSNIVGQVVAKSTAQHSVSAPSGATDYPLENIKLRETDTRELDLERVQELIDSIAEVGLCQALTIDRSGKLIAGRHRLEALWVLKKDHLDVFSRHFKDNLVPTYIMDFCVDDDPERGLLVEAAENCNRKNYTQDEVRGIAQRLELMGYVAAAGRPKKGQKTLHPTIAKIFGKTDRWVRQMLREVETAENEVIDGESDSKVKQIDLNKQIKSSIRSLKKVQDGLEEQKMRGKKSKIAALEEIINQLTILMDS
jgi:ParB family transcriptional regulator, chromosome partitioning protein